MRACALLLAVASASACRAESLPSHATPSAPAPASAGDGLVAPRQMAPPSTMLRVIVGGDLLPHRPSLISPRAIREALAPLGPLFAKADAVVANYEAATGDIDSMARRLAYAAPPAWLEELPKAGLSAITVANNHACDLEEDGLAATLDGAVTSGLQAIGAGKDDPWTPRVLAEQAGKRICAIGWTTFVNAPGSCARSNRLAVAPPTSAGRQRIDRALAMARARCDATIAIFHGGDEYAAQTGRTLEQAYHAAEGGADAVVIHHPHVASPVVVHKTKDGRKVPIFASVGNLVTNQGESWKPPMFPVLQENRRLVCVNGWTRLGVLADLSFVFAERSVRLDWGFHLVWIENPHADDRTVSLPKIEARLLEPVTDAVVMKRLSDDARGPLALFSDPCWIERQGDAEATARCSTPLGPASSRVPEPSAALVKVVKRVTQRRHK